MCNTYVDGKVGRVNCMCNTYVDGKVGRVNCMCNTYVVGLTVCAIHMNVIEPQLPRLQTATMAQVLASHLMHRTCFEIMV